MKKKLIIFIPICILLVVCIFIVIPFFKTPKTDELLGLWSVDGNTKYEFNEKGKGKLIVPSAEYKFTYKVNENIISIDFENKSSIDVDYKYKINKDELEITNTKEAYLTFKIKKAN